MSGKQLLPTTPRKDLQHKREQWGAFAVALYEADARLRGTIQEGKRAARSLRFLRTHWHPNVSVPWPLKEALIEAQLEHTTDDAISARTAAKLLVALGAVSTPEMPPGSKAAVKRWMKRFWREVWP